MNDEIKVTRTEMTALFTEWLRRCTEYPEQFDSEYPSCEEYGPGATIYFLKLLGEMRNEANA